MFYVHFRRMCTLPMCGVFYVGLLGLIGLQCSSFLFPWWSSLWLFYPVLRVWYQSLEILSKYSFSPWILSVFLLQVCKPSCSVHSCYIILADWCFYHSIMSCVSYNNLCLEVYFVPYFYNQLLFLSLDNFPSFYAF